MKFSQLLANADTYGKPVALKLRGATNFQTPCGGLLTIIMNSLTAWLCIISFKKMVMREEPTI